LTTNWNGGALPGSGDTAYIVNGGTATVTTADPNFGSLSLGNALGAGTVQMTAGSLSAEYQLIGDSGTGAFIQSGGSNTVNIGLCVGNNPGTSGTYNLNGGWLSVGSGGAGMLDVGYYGTGTFTQSAGTIAISGTAYVGHVLGSSGTYSLSGGSLSVLAGGALAVGWAGGGSFSQSGGTSAPATLLLGYNLGGSGTYSLYAGLLSPQSLQIGCAGTGSFTQYGGTNTVAAYLGLGTGVPASSGSYTLVSGSLSASGFGAALDVGLVGTGTFTQFGGGNTISGSLYIGHQSGSNGTYSLSGGSLSLSSGSMYVGYSGTGNFLQSGGSSTVSGTLYVGDGGTGTFTQSGGTNTVNGALQLGNNTGNASYSLSNGQLSATTETLITGAPTSTAVFTQTGGSNTTGFLNIGSSASYTLTGGTLTATGPVMGPGPLIVNGGNCSWTANAGIAQIIFASTPAISLSSTLGNSYQLGQTTCVGQYGTASLAQSGGLQQAGTAYFGYNSGATGNYALSGGTLTAGIEYLGYSGTGTFTQSGGSNGISSGGTLCVGYSGTGTFTQSGGSNAAWGLYLGYNAGSSGTYSLGAGSYLVTGGTLCVGSSGTGTFTQSGGTNANTVGGTLYVGCNPGGNGSYSLSGGSLGTFNVEYLGFSGTGAFTQSGGTNTVNNVLCVGYNPGSNGSYLLSGGQLTASSESIGSSSASVTGAFTQSGGSNSTHTLSIGTSGSYTLTGGTLSVSQQVTGSGPLVVNGNASWSATNGLPLLVLASSPTVNVSCSLGSGNQLGGVTYVGQSGTASLTQSSAGQGAGNIYFGYNSGATGNYTLSGGTLLASSECLGYNGTGTFTQSGGSNAIINNGPLYVGYWGTGTFTQSAGTTTVAGTAYLGYNSGSSGAGWLSGGLFTAPCESIGYNSAASTGAFTQSGGSNSTGSLLIGANGSYTLSGGTLNVMGPIGGTGPLAVNGSASWVFNGGYPLSQLIFASTPATAMSCTLTNAPQLGITTFVGQSGAANVTQANGLQSIQTLYCGYNAGASGNYALSGGTLGVAGSEYLGYSGTGSFTQSPGSNSVTGGLCVGYSGAGTFTQSGGTNTVNGTLFFGCNPGSNGTYLLSGGQLTAAAETNWVGGGTPAVGAFIQSGGINNITAGNLSLGPSGSYTLSGGTLSVAGQINGTLAVNGSASWSVKNGAIPQITFASAPAVNMSCSLSNGATLGITTYVGQAGTANVTQAGGLQQAGTVYCGYNSGATGNYTLSAGTLTAASECFGYSGAATFAQSGGTNLTSGNAYLGYNSAGGTGNYVLSAGSNSVTGSLYLGYSGAGSFTQSGGTNTVNGTLYIGCNPGSSGTYLLSGGQLTAAGETSYLGLGTPAAATFIQSGGVNTITAGNLYLGPSGSYTLTGGTLSVPGQVNGAFTQTGGSNAAGSLYIGASGYALSGGTLNVTGSVGGTGPLLVNGNACWSLAGGMPPLVAFASAATVNMSCFLGNSSQLAATTYVGQYGTANVVQPGGVQQAGTVYFGYNSGATGNYWLTGGTLTAGSECLGYSGAGTLTQFAGTNSVSALSLGCLPGSSGSYNLNGGVLVASDESVGGTVANTTGTFTQSGGSNTTGSLFIAISGSYTLTGGTLNVTGQLTGPRPLVVDGDSYWSVNGPIPLLTFASTPAVNMSCALGSSPQLGNLTYVGQYGTASLTQSGGTQQAGIMYFGCNSGATGNYSLSGGSLGASAEIIGWCGTGGFTQSGGTNAAGAVSIGKYSGSSATYSLSGGSFSAVNGGQGALYLGELGGTGSFTQSGGASTLDTLYAGYEGTGTYNLLAGSLSSAGSGQFVGYWGTGTFTQSGGTSTAPSLMLGFYAGSSGTYNLNGGLLILSALSGGSGTAAFNFSGGTLAAAAPFSTNLPMAFATAGSNATLDNGGYSATLAGPLSGPGGLIATGSGTLILAVPNTYTGNTLVSGGTLTLADPAALEQSTLDTSGAGTVSFGSLAAATLGGLTGSGPLVLNNTTPAPVALTVGNNNASTTFSGTLSGSGSVTEVGSGTLTFTGSNSYTGGTTVASGQFVAENAQAIPTGSLLAIGASGSVVLGTPGAAELLGLSPGGGPLGAQAPQGGGSQGAPASGDMHAVPEPGTLALLAAAAAWACAWRRAKRRGPSQRQQRVNEKVSLVFMEKTTRRT
jgi:hypothetical protein